MANSITPIIAKPTTPSEREALEQRATDLMGCTEGSPEEQELKAICDSLEEEK